MSRRPKRPTRQQWALFDMLADGGKVQVDPAGKAWIVPPGRRRLDVTNKYQALRAQGLVAAEEGLARLTGHGLSVAAGRATANLIARRS